MVISVAELEFYGENAQSGHHQELVLLLWRWDDAAGRWFRQLFNCL